MGIAYFPEIYPDELIYSLLARYYVHSGYTSNALCFKDIYMKTGIRPDIEFINQITYEIKKQIKKQASWEQIIWKHTMYPYYSRFLEAEKREEAWRVIMAMESRESVVQPRFSRILSLPHSKEQKFSLKYCPICVREDRKCYGETYWHRRHQIRGLDTCSQHGCKLFNSTISLMSYNGSAVLKCAELEVGRIDRKHVMETDELRGFASYVVEILEQDSFAPYDETVKMLYRKSRTLYSYGRQKVADMEALNDDFQAWKRDAGMKDGITELWQIKKLLCGYRRSPYEVCQMAYFLKVDVDEVAHPAIGEDDIVSIDGIVVKLINREKRLIDVAEEAGISISTLKSICDERGIRRNRKQDGADRKKKQRINEERVYWLALMKQYPDMSYNSLCLIKEHRKHLNYLRRNDRTWTDEHWFHGCRKKGALRDWKKLDDEMLPKVKEAIATLLSGRPQNVCIYSVAKRTGIPSRTYDVHLAKCKEEISKYKMSTKELHAREVVWAVDEIQNEGKTIDWKQIKILTNMSKDKLIACMPYLKDIAEPKVYEMVQTLL